MANPRIKPVRGPVGAKGLKGDKGDTGDVGAVDGTFSVSPGTASRSTRARFADKSHVNDWGGVAGDGATDDWINFAPFLAQENKHLILQRGKTYRVAGGVFSVGAGSLLETNGAEILFDRLDNSNATQITIGAGAVIERFKLTLAENKSVARLMVLNDAAKIRDMKITAVSQVPLGNDATDACVRILGIDVEIDDLHVRNFGLPVLFSEGYTYSGATLRGLRFWSYLRGLNLGGRTHITIEDLIGRGTYYNAEDASLSYKNEPGYNLCVSGGEYQTMRGIKCLVDDPDAPHPSCGEHAIYLSGGTPGVSPQRRGLIISDVLVQRPGQCVIKLRNWRDFLVKGIVGTDCSTNNTAGTNEDGFRGEGCDHGQILGLDIHRDLKGTSCNDGVYLDDCTEIMGRAISIDTPAAYGLHAVGATHSLDFELSVTDPGTRHVEIDTSSDVGKFRVKVDADGNSGVAPVSLTSAGALTKKSVFRGDTDYAGAQPVAVDGTTNVRSMMNDGIVPPPSASNSAGYPGQRAYDSSYSYKCTALNTWRRVAHATW